MKLLILIFSFLFIACSKEKVIYKDVYIPTKCELEERDKPRKEKYTDFTEFQAELRAYYKGIEQDLYFCRTGKKEE